MTRLTVQPDALWLTERAQKHAAATGARESITSNHVLQGSGITYGRDDVVDRRAARYLRRRANRHGCRAAARSEVFLRVAARPGPLARHAFLLAAVIAADPAGYCGDDRHTGDLAQAAEWLQWLGFIPTPPARPPASTASARPRATRYGRCSKCGRKKNLRNDGTIARHKRSETTQCTGEGLPPAEEDA